jgi:hypothetical protein
MHADHVSDGEQDLRRTSATELASATIALEHARLLGGFDVTSNGQEGSLCFANLFPRDELNVFAALRANEL